MCYEWIMLDGCKCNLVCFSIIDDEWLEVCVWFDVKLVM